MKRFQLVLALFLMAFCPILAQKTNNVKLINVSAINSTTLDFSPTFYKEGVVFVSCNATKGQKKTYDSRIHKTAMSIFISKRNENGVLQKPEPFSLDMSTSLHEGPLCFDRFNEVVYFCRNDIKKIDENSGEKVNYVKGFSHMKIYVSQHTPNGWAEAEALPFNDDASDACHPTISADGNRLYFASNRVGGFGGMDLYMSEKVYGEWSAPVNLGPTINSSNNEVFPYIHESGILFYSKDGNNEKGDLDIFYTQKNESGAYIAPLNLGYPFNSEGDDFGLIIDSDKKSGYLTSDREGGKGEDDIYAFHAPYGLGFLNYYINKYKSYNVVNIVVTDRKTGQPLSNALVSMAVTSESAPTAQNSNLKFEYFRTDKNGKAIVQMSPQESYLIKTDIKNFQPAEVSVLKNNSKKDILIPLDFMKEGTMVQKDNTPAKSSTQSSTLKE